MTGLYNVITVLAISGFAGAAAAGCVAESSARKVALLELYTSEGCYSCPPADRWVRELPSRGFTPDRVVTLAFHVDYWDYLGWPDPYSKAQYSERQRAASLRNRSRMVYTPQLLLNGNDYRRGTLLDGLDGRLRAISREPARSKISLRIHPADDGAVRVTGTATVAALAGPAAQAYLALYENNLSNRVVAGENRGKELRHDFVVRELAGPFPVNSAGEALLEQRFRLEPEWKRADLNVAAFVQDERSGDVLQALVIPYCNK